MAPCPDVEPEDQTAGQVEKDVVKHRGYVKGDETSHDTNAVFSYEQGKAHGTISAPPSPAPGVDLGQYWEGYNEGVGKNLREGIISPNRARELLTMWTREGEPIPAQPAFDAVKIPQHYNTGQIEVANFIADQGLDYVSGNVIKYVARAGKKDPAKEIEDLEKAAAYLQMRHNLAKGLPAVVRDPETREVVWSLFRN
ncbi:hypothetical protein SEA_DAMASCUS_65 [Microbacterium phage Damascus]|nr:hypothetical protein SEA_DAMASCUS_65 [Microbacterium phage Damascus]